MKFDTIVCYKKSPIIRGFMSYINSEAQYKNPNQAYEIHTLLSDISQFLEFIVLFVRDLLSVM